MLTLNAFGYLCGSVEYFRSKFLCYLELTIIKPCICCSLQPIEPSSTRRRARTPSYLLTSDEHLNFLESKVSKVKKVVSKAKKDGAGKKIVDTGKCGEASHSKKRQSKQLQLPVPAASKSTDKTLCSYCEVPYCETNVSWYKCRICKKWSCGNCACVGRRSRSFICDGCK